MYGSMDAQALLITSRTQMHADRDPQSGSYLLMWNLLEAPLADALRVMSVDFNTLVHVRRHRHAAQKRMRTPHLSWVVDVHITKE